MSTRYWQIIIHNKIHVGSLTVQKNPANNGVAAENVTQTVGLLQVTEQQ